MRTLLILLFALLLGSTSAHSAHKFISTRAHEGSSPKAARAVSAQAGGNALAASHKMHAERRLHKLMHRIWRALPDEDREPMDMNSLLAFIFGVVALVGLSFFPLLILLSIPALTLGIIGLGKTKREGMKGKGLAIAGIVLGSLGILVMLAGVVATILIVAFFLK